MKEKGGVGAEGMGVAGFGSLAHSYLVHDATSRMLVVVTPVAPGVRRSLRQVTHTRYMKTLRSRRSLLANVKVGVF